MTSSKVGVFLVMSLVPWFVGCGVKVVPAQGTSDVGGGNGAAGRVFEAYARSPQQEVAYKEHIEPIMDRLSDGYNESVGVNDETPFHWGALFSLKKWYFVPAKLQTIPTDTLGLAFMTKGSQQLAVQKKDSIWIDSTIYDEMSRSDQAYLLLHEFIMSLYFLKFYSVSELCEFGNRAMLSRETCSSRRELDKFFPAAEQKPLSDADYENIRNVTVWVMNNVGLSYSDFMAKLNAHSFDQRLFLAPENMGDLDEEQVFSSDELESLIINAKILNKMPTECVFSGTGAQGVCGEFDVTSQFDSRVWSKSISISSFFKGVKVLDDTYYLNDQSEGTLIPQLRPLGRYFQVVLTNAPQEPAPRVGAVVRSLHLIIKDSEVKGLELEGLFVNTGVVTQVPSSPGDMVCVTGAPNPTGVHLDSWFAVSDISLIGPMRQYVQLFPPPLYFCP